jgi:thiol-disulfide isomerase/thioredoxin
VRPPVDHIAAPPFPGKLPWINAAMVRMDQQIGRPVLIEFWDFCRANSIRTLPYLQEWQRCYDVQGLRVIGVHASGFPPSADPEAVRAAVARLAIEYPVVVDTDFEIWKLYGNLGWPARYLFDQRGMLFHYHYGEGGYEETELAIQELLGIERETMAPLRAEDAAGTELVPQTEDVEGAFSGPYEAGGVWAVLEGTGTVRANGAAVAVSHPGVYCLISHSHSTRGELSLELDDGVICHAVCFTPGLRPEPAPSS